MFSARSVLSPLLIITDSFSFFAAKIRSEPHVYVRWEQTNPLCVGENVVIHCIVYTQDPDTKYRWFYSNSSKLDEKELGVLIDPSRYEQPPYTAKEMEMNEVKFKLKLKNLTIHDSGIYGCQAENSVGSVSRMINLTVSYCPPTPGASWSYKLKCRHPFRNLCFFVPIMTYDEQKKIGFFSRKILPKNIFFLKTRWFSQ